MFETLKDLEIGDLLTIDNRKVRELSGCEDYEVRSVTCYSHDAGELIFIDLDTFFLVAHTFVGDEPAFFIYELNASGEPTDLEDDGFTVACDDDQSLPEKVVSHSHRRLTYKATSDAIMGMSIDRNDLVAEDALDVSVCEYRGKTKFQPFLLIERLDTTFNLYRGFMIKSSAIIL